MTEFIIGKEGNAPFEISNDCVSRRHARVTVSESGWTLEDLDSTNGTYIRDENGDFQRIKKIEITEFTRIALGATNASGFHFYAHHLLEKEGNYECEMQHVVSLYSKLNKERERIEEKNNQQGYIVKYLPGIVSAIITLIIYLILPPKYSKYAVIAGSVTAILATFGSILMQKHTNTIKKYSKMQQKLIRCPKCNKPLSAIEIENEQCNLCKTHS